MVDQTKLVTAASELSRNTLVYGGGDMEWEILDSGSRTGLRLTFRDQGPEIPDIELALKEGWTSGKRRWLRVHAEATCATTAMACYP